MNRLFQDSDAIIYIENHIVSVSETGCWIFSIARNIGGYGQAFYKRVKYTSHRFSYLVHIGDVPEGMHVLHRCNIKLCCNPDHLYIGDSCDNAIDNLINGGSPNANKTHCPQGHEYTDENTYRYPGRSGRHCKICVNSRLKLLKASRREQA